MNVKSLIAAVAAVVFSSSFTLAHEVSLNGHVFTLPDGFEIELAAGTDLVPQQIASQLVGWDQQGCERWPTI